METGGNNLLLGVLLVSIFFVSLFYSLHYRLAPVTDARAYDNIGWNLARGYGYIELEENRENPIIDDSIIRVGPGYELFLAGIYRVFGHDISSVWIFHALARVISTMLLYKIVFLIFKNNSHKKPIALLSAFLFGFSPDLILINGMLLTETLLITGLIIATYFSIRYMEDKRVMTAFYAGLSFGLTALVRPTVLLATVLFFFILLVYRRYKHAALFIIIPVIVVGGWSLRNSFLYERPLFTTTAGSYDLWVGNHSEATGGFDKTEEIQKARNSMHSTELSSFALKKYFTFLSEHPFQFIELQFRKTAIYFSLIRPTGFWSFLRSSPLEQILTLVGSGVWTLILFVFGASGAIYLFSTMGDIKTKLFLLFAFLQPLAVIPIIVETRYRYPLFPFLAVCAAFFMVKFLTETKEKKALYRTFGEVVILFVSLTFYDIWMNVGEFFLKLNN